MNTKTKLKLKVDLLENIKPTKDWIYFDDDPLLKQQCEEVTTLDDNDIMTISKMVSYIDACYEDKDRKYKIKSGIAVAAPQMGLLKRIIYVHFKEDGVENKYLLANPKIISKSMVFSYLSNGEGCLSVKQDSKGYVPRNYKIIVEATDLFTGEKITFSAVELLSICLQHEIDHLDGILYHDHINKKSPMHIDAKWLVIN